MTFAEQLEAKGKDIGIQLGMQEGYQLGQQNKVNKGHQEATRQLTKQLFANVVDRQIIKTSTVFTENELNTLFTLLA